MHDCDQGRSLLKKQIGMWKWYKNALLYNKIWVLQYSSTEKTKSSKKPLLTKSSVIIEVFLFISRNLYPGMWKWYKNALLYNKIECYNIAVPRRLNIKKSPC